MCSLCNFFNITVLNCDMTLFSCFLDYWRFLISLLFLAQDTFAVRRNLLITLLGILPLDDFYYFCNSIITLLKKKSQIN
jgi:hypothetical protein